MLATLHGVLETNLQDAFYFGTGVEVGIICFIVVLVFLAEVHTSGQLANADKVRAIHQFRAERRLVNQAFESLHGTDIGKQSQFLAHGQQSLFGAYFGCRVIVEFRVAYGRKQYRIRILASLVRSFGERITHLIYRIRAADGVFITHFMSELLANGGHHIHAYSRNLGADTVTGQYCNFKVHSLLFIPYLLVIILLDLYLSISYLSDVYGLLTKTIIQRSTVSVFLFYDIQRCV